MLFSSVNEIQNRLFFWETIWELAALETLFKKMWCRAAGFPAIRRQIFALTIYYVPHFFYSSSFRPDLFQCASAGS